MTPARSLTELEDVSDSTSSLDSGEWTDLSSAHADDVSDAASLDGEDHPTRPVSHIGALDDGSEEAWTAADPTTSPSASLYASAHIPLNPFEHETANQRQRSPEPYPANTYEGIYGPLDPFRAPSDTDSSPSDRTREHSGVRELELILPDPLERSDSTVAADLSFSDDAVLATSPSIIVSLAGVPPSVIQRAAVVADVLLAIAKATHSSYVRPDYHNFTTLSDLPRRVKLHQEQTKEISVLVCDSTNDPLTHPNDEAPSILVVFTSDLHNSIIPPIPIQSILIPIVLNEAAGPVVLFDEDRDDRAPDETAVDIDALVRQLSNLFTIDHHSDTATQTAVDTLDGKSVVASEYMDEAILNTDNDTPDERSDEHPNDRLLPKRESWPHVVEGITSPELADVLKRASKSISPRWTAACAFAVVLSLLLGTGHLIQTARPASSYTTVTPTQTTILDPVTHLPTVQTALAVKSQHTSLALKSSQTSLALKSPHTAVAVKSAQTALAKVSHVPINESCSSASSHASSSVASLSTSNLSISTSLSSVSTSSAPTPSSTSTSTETERARTLASVAEDLSGAIDRIERVLGWNVRQAVGKADAAGKAQVKAIIDVADKANAAFEATSGVNPMEAAGRAAQAVHGSHQTARKNAQRQFASIKRGVNVLGEKVGLGKSNEGTEKNTKGKKRASAKKRKESKENIKPRPGREKWQTSKGRSSPPEKDKAAHEDKGKGKATFPTRGEQEKAHTAGRGKHPTTDPMDDEPAWTWSVTTEWEDYQGRPRTVMEEVREYIHHGAYPFGF